MAPVILDLGYRGVLRPVLFRAYDGDAERVHEQTLRMVSRLGESPPALRAVAALCARHRRPVTVAGVRFPGLVGLAAGMDKNGVGVQTWGALGFGHAELGTVTAQPQPGNPVPRLFRLPRTGAVINRMGFNNRGAQALADRLEAVGVRRGNRAVGIPLGISIGKTKTVPLAEATPDYLDSLQRLAPYADYVAVNVSSPNTPGLRTLQDGDNLRDLVAALVARTRVLDPVDPVPVFVKVAPDLSEDALEEALAVCVSGGALGVIATNTTLSRDGLALAEADRAVEAGGLSGSPLTRRAREVVAFLSARTDLPVIGVGGVMSADDGRALLDAGAALLQVYTGYIFRGPALVAELNRLEPAGPPSTPRRG